MSVNNSAPLNVNPAPACMELIPYVPAEQVLNIPRNNNQQQEANGPVHTGSFARINPNLVQHVISYLPVLDLPEFARTCKGNQTQAVSQCFRRMRETESGTAFKCFTYALTECRGCNRPFKAADIFQIQGTCRVTQFLKDASYLLGDDQHNTRFAQKFPGLEMLRIDGPTPNLSCFAAHSPELHYLWLQNGTLSDETLPDRDFPSLKTLMLHDCQVTDANMDRLLTRCPQIQICSVSPENIQDMTERMIAVDTASCAGTLNALVHGSKEGKPESKKAE